MDVTVTFDNDIVPVSIYGPDDMVLKAIEKIKEKWTFILPMCSVNGDEAHIHVIEKDRKPVFKKRLYVYKDKVIWQTPYDCDEEIDPTRELLAYERNAQPDEIYVIGV